MPSPFRTAGPIALFAAILLTGTRVPAADDLPEFEEVEQAAARHFDGLDHAGDGRLLAREDVEPLFAGLAKAGWDVPAKTQDELLQRILPRKDFLVRTLRTRAGRKFEQKLARFPDVYDRLDRFRRLPRGERIIKQMIHAPGGHELFEYMVTTPGGENLGKQLSKAKGGRNFNQPTGRLYTREDVLEELRRLYDAAAGSKDQAESSPGK